jgi:hypothetical protein
MIPNKVKNYFKINDINKKPVINTNKKKEYSAYNIGSLFNSRKDRCKELLTEKKLISVFNKYINNKTKPFKKNSYFNLESINSQMSQYSHIKNEYIVNSPYNLNPKTYNKDFYNSRSSYEDNNIKKIKKNKKNYSLTKKSINKSINISIHHSFLNNSISCLRKNKNKNGLMIKHNTKKFIKNLDSLNFNHPYFFVKFIMLDMKLNLDKKLDIHIHMGIMALDMLNLHLMEILALLELSKFTNSHFIDAIFIKFLFINIFLSFSPKFIFFISPFTKSYMTKD